MVYTVLFRSSRPEVFYKKGVLGYFAKFTGKHPCKSLFFNKVAGLTPETLLKKETLAQVFSSEFCDNSKNSFPYRTPRVCNLIKEEALAQVFSCEFCKISKNTFSYRTPLVAASEESITLT